MSPLLNFWAFIDRHLLSNLKGKCFLIGTIDVEDVSHENIKYIDESNSKNF